MFQISQELKSLADVVISENKQFKPIIDTECRIVYQWSENKKSSNGKVVFADTMKVSDKLKAVAGCDFIITFYKPSCEALDAEKMKILMKHELKHVGIRDDGSFYIVPHDVEDFSDIIDEYGMKWVI